MSHYTSHHVVRMCLAHSLAITYTRRIDISSVLERHGDGYSHCRPSWANFSSAAVILETGSQTGT